VEWPEKMADFTLGSSAAKREATEAPWEWPKRKIFAGLKVMAWPVGEAAASRSMFSAR
jgi:hypothetical protein